MRGSANRGITIHVAKSHLPTTGGQKSYRGKSPRGQKSSGVHIFGGKNSSVVNLRVANFPGGGVRRVNVQRVKVLEPHNIIVLLFIWDHLSVNDWSQLCCCGADAQASGWPWMFVLTVCSWCPVTPTGKVCSWPPCVARDDAHPLHPAGQPACKYPSSGQPDGADRVVSPCWPLSLLICMYDY